ncbi:branched-chain amino acid ABC transporter substrate-binding protein [Curvibacter sp. APW13]|uniref:branched-chain amino acid ABC transporter substrate-binding protein n=1 Tax=Curvibacter sp. APW13 TaxID=3077236 RepID=UPI0028E00719|nr:branched-chain amino acid ABC transporter substrate-binding protein [Curvibacter sp. APW13]MDT8992014.1 branched-chain amino acid ABC transporter substrate-binding protein [Curvibacter sp. APW13]
MTQTPSRRTSLALLAALTLLGSASLTGCNSAPSTIKIGVAQPLSGPLAALGKDMLNGVELAVEELNKEGFQIKGKIVKLEVVAVDDHADAKAGVDAAKQLVDAGVSVVIGHLNSGVSIAAAPIYAEKSIPQLAISTNPKYTELGLPTTLRLVANDKLQAKAIGSFSASQFPATRYATVDDGTPYGKDLAAGAASELTKAKKEIVAQGTFDEKTVKFDEFAAKLKEAKAEALISTLSDFQLVALLEALGKIDYNRITVLGADTVKTPDMLKGAGLASSLYVTSPILEPREFPAGKAFLDRYRTKFQTVPAYAGHYSYDATFVVASAIKRAESGKPEAILQALRKIDGYAPVTGSMKWDDKGEQRYGVIGVYQARGGNWESRVRSDSW